MHVHTYVACVECKPGKRETPLQPRYKPVCRCDLARETHAKSASRSLVSVIRCTL